MSILKVKKLKPEACLPFQATEDAAGFDLTSTSLELDDGKYIYGTGLAAEIPAGHVGLLFPRSSVHKTGLLLSNSVGVIDSDYRGEIKLIYTGQLLKSNKPYGVGDRVGQLVIVPCPKFQIEETSELSDTTRGQGGFGSTGK